MSSLASQSASGPMLPVSGSVFTPHTLPHKASYPPGVDASCCPTAPHLMMRRGLRISFPRLLGPGSPALLHPASLLAPAGESSVDKPHLSVGVVVGYVLFLVISTQFWLGLFKRYQNQFIHPLSCKIHGDGDVKPNNCEDASSTQ